jgi:hypothetical protein
MNLELVTVSTLTDRTMFSLTIREDEGANYSALLEKFQATPGADVYWDVCTEPDPQPLDGGVGYWAFAIPVTPAHTVALLSASVEWEDDALECGISSLREVLRLLYAEHGPTAELRARTRSRAEEIHQVHCSERASDPGQACATDDWLKAEKEIVNRIVYGRPEGKHKPDSWWNCHHATTWR